MCGSKENYFLFCAGKLTITYCWDVSALVTVSFSDCEVTLDSFNLISYFLLIFMYCHLFPNVLKRPFWEAMMSLMVPHGYCIFLMLKILPYSFVSLFGTTENMIYLEECCLYSDKEFCIKVK